MYMCLTRSRPLIFAYKNQTTGHNLITFATIIPWYTGAQEWHIVSLVGDVTSPTTAVHYVRFMCSEHREALLSAPTAHGVRKQCKGEVHSSPRSSREASLSHSSGWGNLKRFPSVSWFAHSCPGMWQARWWHANACSRLRDSSLT